MHTAPFAAGNFEYIVSASEWEQYCRLCESMYWYTQPQRALFDHDANALMPFVPHSASPSQQQQGALLGSDVKT